MSEAPAKESAANAETASTKGAAAGNKSAASTNANRSASNNAKAKSNKGRRGNRNQSRRPQRNDMRDFGPPRFNLEEMEAIAGAPLWQAQHPAVVKDLTDVAVFVEVTPEGHPALRAAIPSSEFVQQPAVGDAITIWLLDPPASLPTSKAPASKAPASDLPASEAADDKGSEAGDVASSDVASSDVASKDAAPVAEASVSQISDAQNLSATRTAFEGKKRVNGVVIGEVKGGFAVALGVANRDESEASTRGLRAFLPRSQASLGRFGPRNGEVVGTVDEFDITELDWDRANIVVSRKAGLQETRKEDREKTWSDLEVGKMLRGQVKAIMPYGAFVDVGGVDGLIHQSDLSWDRQPRVSDVLKEGQVLDFVVVLVDKTKKKLKLGLKQLTPDPWAEAREKIVAGNDVTGVVVALADFGVFLKLLDGVEGLIHISEVSWTKIKHPSSRFNIGQEVTARVLEFDVESRRVSLSTKVLEENPWQAVASRFPVGTVLKAKVKSLADFGAFVEIDGNVDGMVHVGEISWTEHIEHPSEVLTIGEEVEVVVLRVDVDKHRVACSMKQTQENPFERWDKEYAPGKRLTLTVSRVTESGAVFDLEDGLHAFCHKRELSEEPIDRAVDAAKVGEKIEVEVKRLDRRRKRVDVSVKAVVLGDTKAAYDEYKKREAGGEGARVTLASQLQNALGVSLSSTDEGKGDKKEDGPVRTQAVGEAPGEDPGYDPKSIETEDISTDDGETDEDGNVKSS